MTTQAHYDNSVKTNDVVIGYNKYLSHYKRNSLLTYRTALTSYLIFIYPELERLRNGKKYLDYTEEVEEVLQEASVRYLTESRDYLSDLTSFRNYLESQKKASQSKAGRRRAPVRREVLEHP
ncbi:MAG: hypothetical protein ABSA11_10230 [Candidatus Bathyarchaeia archaeon]|jgi:hypothetical protein